MIRRKYLCIIAEVVSIVFFKTLSCTMTVSTETNTKNVTYSNASYLLEQMLQGYDIRLRPGFGVLEMDIVIASFDSVSEVNMDYTVTMYLHQYWRDERLSWGDSGRTHSMTLSGDFAKSIWVPDTFLANDKNSFLHDVTETNKMLRLYADGYIAYGMRFTSTLACHMNLRHYPMDSQKCTIEIESYGYTQSEVLMLWREGQESVKGVKEAEIPQFQIINYQTTNRSVETATGKYQRLSLEFYLQRSIGYFIFQTYLPCILIVMLSWVSFWINHEATSARVALGITTVLTMTTISTGVRQSLPRISYIKSIDIYLVMCFVFVFAALLEYAAVNYSYWGMKSRQKKHSDANINPDTQMPGDNDAHDDTEGRLEFPMLPESVTGANEAQSKLIVKDGNIIGHSPSRVTRHNIEDDWNTPHPGYHRKYDSTSAERQLLTAGNELENDEQQQDSRLEGAKATSNRSPPTASSRRSEQQQDNSADYRRRSMSPIPTLTSAYNQQHTPQHSMSPSASGAHLSHSTTHHSRIDVSEPNAGCMTVHRMRHGQQTARLKRANQRGSNVRRGIQALRKRAKSFVPRIRDINIIDKYSRVVFPSSFVLFNAVYWVYYVIIADKIGDAIQQM